LARGRAKRNAIEKTGSRRRGKGAINQAPKGGTLVHKKKVLTERSNGHHAGEVTWVKREKHLASSNQRTKKKEEMTGQERIREKMTPPRGEVKEKINKCARVVVTTGSSKKTKT